MDLFPTETGPCATHSISQLRSERCRWSGSVGDNELVGQCGNLVGSCHVVGTQTTSIGAGKSWVLRIDQVVAHLRVAIEPNDDPVPRSYLDMLDNRVGAAGRQVPKNLTGPKAANPGAPWLRIGVGTVGRIRSAIGIGSQEEGSIVGVHLSGRRSFDAGLRDIETAVHIRVVELKSVRSWVR